MEVLELVAPSIGSTYIFVELTKEIKNCPVYQEVRRIDVVIHSDICRIEMRKLTGTFILRPKNSLWREMYY